ARNSRSVRRLTIRSVSFNRSSAASYIGGSVASLFLSVQNAAVRLKLVLLQKNQRQIYCRRPYIYFK
ncbi:MAG: hypothetical protein IJY93_05465, partial [Clostridia bacterium]|nr:hypothetical protein [Clostridia bacterium]